MRVRIFTVLLLLIPALAACGGGNGRTSGGKPSVGKPSGNSGVSQTPLAGGETSANPLASPKLPPSLDPSAGESRPCDPKIQYNPNAGVPGKTYIRAFPRGQNQWGPGCLALNPGDKCGVQWEGAYSLAVGTEVHLLFQMWAKGQSKPVKELSAGPLPPENNFRRLEFPVTIPKAEEVAFRVVLLDQTKRPVAIGDSHSYKINCPPGLK